MKRQTALWAGMMLFAAAMPAATFALTPGADAAPAKAAALAAGTTPAADAAPAKAGDKKDAGSTGSSSSAAPATSAPATTTQPPAAAPPTDSATPSTDTGKMPADQFELRVKDLQEKVTDLKEKIYRTKARLLLLQESVIGDTDLSSAKAIIVHRNEMGASFVLESVAYALDGAPIFTRVSTNGSLEKQEEIEVFNGRIVPGNHQISVRMKFRGSGFGIFSYLNGYKFNVQSSYTFNAEGGKVTRVKTVAFEKGGFTTDLKDRPAIRFEEQVTKEQPSKKDTGAPSAAAKPSAGAAGGSP